eukprot:11061258-Ditylum_brightwellii.AAC.1
MEANSMIAVTTLGGGLYGHLALVCDANAYGKIPGALAYSRPTHPMLTIPTESTGLQIAAFKYQYLKSLCLFESLMWLKELSFSGLWHF